MSRRPFFEEKKCIKKGSGEIIIYSWNSLKKPVGLRDFIWFSKIYLKHKPSIIIGHFVGANISIVVSKLMSFFKARTYIYYHSLSTQIKTDSDNSAFKQNLLKFRKRMFYVFFVDQLICPSSLAKKDVMKFFRLSSKKATVILNAIHDRFPKHGKAIDSDKLIVSYLGRLTKSKNVSGLIESFLEFKKNTNDQQILLRLAGYGRQESEIERLSSQHKDIQLVGQLNYHLIDQYLFESHYTVIPSFSDNLPTVGLESLMNGTPLILSKSTGLSEYCIEQYDCYQFDVNASEMINVFKKLIEPKRKAHHSVMIENARKTYENRFTIDAYNCAMYKLISDD